MDIARHVSADTRPDQTIAILGDAPQICFYAYRHSAATQLYVSQTMDPRPYGRQMQERMIREIEQSKPEYLVFCCIPTSWVVQKNSSPELFDWMVRYTKQNMKMVGLIQFTGPNTVETVWGPKAADTCAFSILHRHF